MRFSNQKNNSLSLPPKHNNSFSNPKTSKIDTSLLTKIYPGNVSKSITDSNKKHRKIMNSEKFSNFLTDLVEYTKKIKFEATGKLKNKDNFLNSEKYSGIKQKINDFHSKKSEISNVSFENLKKLEIY